MLVLALGLGGSLLSSGLAMGCPTQPGQQLSCPGGLLCCVYSDFLCVQMYVFTIVRGRGGNV